MRTTALAALLPFLPGSAAACSACFGRAANSQGLFDGVFWAIVLMLSVTMCMVGGIGWLLWKVEKNRLAHEARG